jgi:hypothetical protein
VQSATGAPPKPASGGCSSRQLTHRVAAGQVAGLVEGVDRHVGKLPRRRNGLGERLLGDHVAAGCEGRPGDRPAHSGRREIDDDAWLELGDRRDEAGTDGHVHPVLAQERLRPRAIEVDQPAELDVGKPRDHRQPQPARVARPDQEDAAHRSYQPGGDQMASSSGGAIPSGAAAQPTAFAIRRRTPSW